MVRTSFGRDGGELEGRFLTGGATATRTPRRAGREARPWRVRSLDPALGDYQVFAADEQPPSSPTQLRVYTPAALVMVKVLPDSEVAVTA